MTYEQILSSWKKKVFEPVYWLEGEEPYFIDKLVEYAEHSILSSEEAGFNLTILYGKDVEWKNLMDALRRYPMFSERQVVLLKEAQQMRDLEKLSGYFEKPTPSTLLVISYKGKKLDGRKQLSKVVQKKTVVMTSKKLYDNQIPDWVTSLVASFKLRITPKATMLLVDHIGGNLSRIEHEINKLSLNLGERKEINEDDIQRYIGISKEFNVFELQNAIGRKDVATALRIINYFKNNPKAAPFQQLLTALYQFFSRTYMVFGWKGGEDSRLAAMLGVHPFFLKDYRQAAKNYGYSGVEKILLLLHDYNLRSVGIKGNATGESGLMKELLFKILN